ncbi:hypothetical protein Lal_00014704 [Lupinus albus]|nr:hypothetical protein Lal_00014704 [Lupinus albus]
MDNYIEALQVGITTGKIFGSFAGQCGGYRYVEFSEKDMYNQIQKQRKNGNGDAETALQYLKEQSKSDCAMYWRHTVDEEEDHAALIYTRAVFKEFRKVLLEAAKMRIISTQQTSCHEPSKDVLRVRHLNLFEQEPLLNELLKVTGYRSRLDHMDINDFKLLPYEIYNNNLPHEVQQDKKVWSACKALICFSIVEWHQTDRVRLQFGFVQDLPQPPKNLDALHKVDKRGNQDTNWATKHAQWIQCWSRRRDQVL